MSNSSRDTPNEKSPDRAPSLSLSAAASTLVWNDSPNSHVPVSQQQELALPRILVPRAPEASMSTSAPATRTARWPPPAAANPANTSTTTTTTTTTTTVMTTTTTTAAVFADPQEGNEAAPTQGHNLLAARFPYAFAQPLPTDVDASRRRLPDTKGPRALTEGNENSSLFDSRGRAVEMSSFGISVSTATAAAGCSASTIPTRWLRSAEVRALSTTQERTPVSTPVASPPPTPAAAAAAARAREPRSVFERWVQLEVVRKEREDLALEAAADIFCTLFPTEAKKRQ